MRIRARQARIGCDTYGAARHVGRGENTRSVAGNLELVSRSRRLIAF
jgi:hypothetical protein